MAAHQLRRWIGGLAAFAALATLSTACSSGSSAGGAGAGGGQTVKVAVLPASLSVPVYLAIEQGYFKAEGLDVSATQVANAAAAVPLVTSGEVQFGLGNIIPFILARSKGLPLKMVVSTDVYSGDPSNDPIAMVVKKGSSITKPADLVGKNVGLLALKAGPELVTRTWLNKAGVDANTVKFVQLSGAAEISALESGSIDAAYMFEPFVTQALQQGDTVLANPASKEQPGVTDGVAVATESYLSQNPSVATKFAAAMVKAGDYANAHPDAVRDVLSRYFKIAPDLLKTLKLGVFAGTTQQAALAESLTSTAQLMTQDGWMSVAPKAQDLVWSTK